LINDFEEVIAQGDRPHHLSQFFGFFRGDVLKPPGEPA
jgi:hypothetical protein